MDFSSLRKDYGNTELSREDLERDPFVLFAQWFEEALQEKNLEPNAMVLSTANSQGQPSSRTVLLKGQRDGKFYFFTNYQSRKAQELEENPRASLLFFWPSLHKQVILEGKVEKTTPEESHEYFASRPRMSQLAAWSSRQGAPLRDREELEASYARQSGAFEGQDVPCPDHWGGYYLTPQRIEFWQGRSSRLHDRFEYLATPLGWKIQRISP